MALNVGFILICATVEPLEAENSHPSCGVQSWDREAIGSQVNSINTTRAGPDTDLTTERAFVDPREWNVVLMGQRFPKGSLHRHAYRPGSRPMAALEQGTGIPRCRWASLHHCSSGSTSYTICFRRVYIEPLIGSMLNMPTIGKKRKFTQYQPSTRAVNNAPACSRSFMFRSTR